MPRIQNLIADTFGTHVGKYQGRLKVTQGGETLVQAPLSELNGDAAAAAATRACLLLLLYDYTISNEFGGEATALNEESLALYRSVGDEWGAALALDALSQKYMNLGVHDTAIRLHEQCLAMRLRLQDQQDIARSYNILG